jgi:hypothetical protein
MEMHGETVKFNMRRCMWVLCVHWQFRTKAVKIDLVYFSTYLFLTFTSVNIASSLQCFLKLKIFSKTCLTDFVFLYLIALLLFPVTALRCHVRIIGDRDQNAHHRSEFPVTVLKPNFASVLNCIRRHYKKTVAESFDNKLCVLRSKNKDKIWN